MRQVVFILSTNYAGSHLLSQLLGAHSSCRSIGELHNYRKYRTRDHDHRDVANEYLSNPAFEGLGELEESQWHERIFHNLAKRGVYASTLIDNSKRPAWARRFVGNRTFECRYVHLLRDPRALVRRWLDTYTTPRTKRRQRVRVIRAAPHLLGTALMGDEILVYAYKWLIANRRITRFLEATNAEPTIVTYRDIAVDTRHALETLMPRLGLAFEPTQLTFGGAMSGTSKRRYATQTKSSTITHDTRWREELSHDQLEMVARDRRIQRYLDSLGLEMAADGLTNAAR